MKNPLNKILRRGFATCLCGWETPLTRNRVIEGYYFRIARVLYLVHRVTKHYPPLGFMYWWREYGLKMAWAQITGEYDPIPSKIQSNDLPNYHCPDCDAIDCLHCFCLIALIKGKAE